MEPTPETPAAEVAETLPSVAVAPPDDKPLSVMDHIRQYDPRGADRAEPTTPPIEQATTETPADDKAHHSAEQRREKDTGQFRDGKKRHRASSAIASPDDVPRIGQLTARAKTAEERVAALEAEMAQMRSAPTPQPAPQPSPSTGNGHPPPIAARQPPMPRVDDPRDPEPQETDPQFGGDPMKYLDARVRWAARDEQRQFYAHQQRQQQELSVNMAFGERVDKAKAKYQDMDAALQAASSLIPDGSLVDQFVMTDDSGPEVLYYFAQSEHRGELDTVLRMPMLPAMKHLALLAQRLVSPPSVQAGVTGSVATPRVRYLPSKPLNPVRTEAQRSESVTAPLDGSLGIRDHVKRFPTR